MSRGTESALARSSQIPVSRGILDQLLKDREAHLAVVEGIPQFALAKNPRGRKPHQRQTQKRLGLLVLPAGGVRMKQQLKILLRANPQFHQHLPSISEITSPRG